MGDSPESIAYAEALRAIGQQETRLESIRSRGVTLLSVAALSASFLGGLGLSGHGLGLPTWVAIACFALLAVVCVYLLWPFKGWRFRLDASQLVRDYVDGENRVDAPVMQRDLALHLAEDIRDNEAKLDRLYRRLRVAAGLLVAEVSVFVLAVARK